MTYEDKVLQFLKNDMQPGEKVLISSLTNTPEVLIGTVKMLIDVKCVDDIEFSNDYIYIRKMWSLTPYKIQLSK